MDGEFVAYYRVSTERQGKSGLGLEAQRKAVVDYLNGGSWKLVSEFIEVETESCSLGPNDVDVAKATAGKTIAIFALPGAFTPTCSAKHVPGYVEKAAELKAGGLLAEVVTADPRIELRLGARCDRVSSDSISASAVLAGSGERLESELLIGADGIHSAVRESLLGSAQPRFTGKPVTA